MKGSELSVSFISNVAKYLRQCGVIANYFQSEVRDRGKTINKRRSDSERLEKMRQAKTTVDIAIQDLLLLGLEEFCALNKVQIDAEEDSIFSKKFEPQCDDLVLVLDPIDGTLEYIEGEDGHSICVGLHQHGSMIAAMVFFPARDVIYFCTDEYSYYASNFMRDGLSNACLIDAPSKVNLAKCSTIYYNNRVPSVVVRGLEDQGFCLISDEADAIGAPDVFISCMLGKSLGYITYTRQIRDILLGAVLAKMPSSVCVDWGGRGIGWPLNTRLPRGFFSCSVDRSEEILLVLRSHNN